MKILIAGGGIGGISAALNLAKTGHEIHVFEQASQLEEAGAGIQLSPNCARVLHHLGLEASLRSVAFLPTATQFRQWKSGKTISENPLGDTVLKRYGHPYYHIHRGDLIQILETAAKSETNIQLHAGSEATGFSQTDEGVTLELENRSMNGDVLIGADGIHSKIRTSLWGAAAPAFTGNIAWRALVPADLIPKGRIRPMSTVWWGPNKHFVHYFVRSGELINCVCVVEKEGWEIESWTQQGQLSELKRDFAGWHKDIQMLIDHADPGSLYKWALFDRPPMTQWGKGRVTLLGDACHPTLPFMAQGAAMAIEDGAVLANCLDSPEGDRIPESLNRYETLRRDRTAGIQKGSRRNASIFHLSGVSAWLRNRAAKRAGASALDVLFRYNALDAGKADSL